MTIINTYQDVLRVRKQRARQALIKTLKEFTYGAIAGFSLAVILYYAIIYTYPMPVITYSIH